MDLIEVAAISGVTGSVLNLIGFAVMMQRYITLARESQAFAGEVLGYLRPGGGEEGVSITDPLSLAGSVIRFIRRM